MNRGAIGRTYKSGESIIRQGDHGKCMYVIQEGRCMVVREEAEREVHLTTLEERDFFGEVPLFERVRDPGVVRATIRADEGGARILTVDRKTILARIHDDPSLAYRILETMSKRIRQLEEDMVRLVTEGMDPSDE